MLIPEPISLPNIGAKKPVNETLCITSISLLLTEDKLCSKLILHNGKLLLTVKDSSVTTLVNIILDSGPFVGFNFPTAPVSNLPSIEYALTAGSHTGHLATFLYNSKTFFD